MFVYNLKAETRRQSITSPDLSWKRDSSFAILQISADDFKVTQVIDLGVTNKF